MKLQVAAAPAILLALCVMAAGQTQPVPLSGSAEGIRYSMDFERSGGMFPLTRIYAHPANPNTTVVRFTIRLVNGQTYRQNQSVDVLPVWAPASAASWGKAAVGSYLGHPEDLRSFQMEEMQVTAVYSVPTS